jgi:pimeloyl-ACP methyl ester carboxylesterase
LLEARGHDVVAVDLPADDAGAGLSEYADAVIDAIGERDELVVVAQSLGGFTAPLVCTRVHVKLLVLLAAMVPSPGETGNDWWTNTGAEEARRAHERRDGRDPDADFDVTYSFFNDFPPDLLAEAMRHGRGQSGTPMEKPWPLDDWPDVPTRFLLCRHDNFFPAEFMRRLARERLGIVADEIDGGHLAALSHPEEVVERLERYREGIDEPSSRGPC